MSRRHLALKNRSRGSTRGPHVERRLVLAVVVAAAIAPGCALVAPRPVDVAWSPTLAQELPTAPLWCFSETSQGENGVAFDVCAPDLESCQQRHDRKASDPQTIATTSCMQAAEPWCFVFDIAGAERATEVRCSATQDACERDNKATNRGMFVPISASTCGPLVAPAGAATTAAAPVDLAAFLNDLDLTTVSTTGVEGSSNATPLKPVTGQLTRRADGTFSLYFSDLLSGGVSEFGLSPTVVKVGTPDERKSTPDEACGTYDMQVWAPPASGSAYRFNDAACAWKIEFTSLPKLPKTNPKDGKEDIGMARGRFILRLVQNAAFKPNVVVAPSWVGGTFEVPVNLAPLE
jgi:hypothetical protein